jgi:hypothetical protein
MSHQTWGHDLESLDTNTIDHLSLEDQNRVLRTSHSRMSAQHKTMLDVYQRYIDGFPVKQKGLKKQCSDIMKALDFAIQERDAYVCRHCVNNCVYFIYIPCKHMVCEGCGFNPTCPICNTLRDKINLFSV